MKFLSCVVVALLLLSTLGGCCCPPAGRPTLCVRDPGPAAETPVQPAEAPTAKKRDAASHLTADEKIAVALSKKRVHGLAWEEMNLDAAVTYLQTITGFKFHISPKVRAESFEGVVINAQLEDVSVHDILSFVLTEPYELRWEVRKGVIWILTNEEIDGKLRLRYFDVKDLSVSIQDFTGSSIWFGPDKEKELETKKSGDDDTKKSGDELVDEIRRTVHRGYWDREGVTIEARNGILIVRASPAVHDAIDEFLAAERGRKGVTDVGKALRAKLEKTNVSLSVKSESLGGVVRMLRITTGFNLMIDPRIVADVASNPISGMQLKDVPLTTALTMLASAAGEQCVWEYRTNVAVLTHKEHVR